MARLPGWPHFPGEKRAFPATDCAPSTGTPIFDIGGNKCRLVARVDFEERILCIRRVLTHEEYDREVFRCPPRLMNSFWLRPFRRLSRPRTSAVKSAAVSGNSSARDGPGLGMRPG
ncbi:MAG: type II toxin-antitoxin system HigB family toxin [Acidobacteria bacterium]|nr:type II toxin-antitoxin system HigB family toxin [Acidobacteriota bacterium]